MRYSISQSGSLADANSYRFSSTEYHKNSGLSYYVYRYYDPNTQRWINRDPKGEFGFEALHRRTVNPPVTDYISRLRAINDLYRFVRNRPTWAMDRFGLDLPTQPSDGPVIPPPPYGPGTTACAFAEEQAEAYLQLSIAEPGDEAVADSLLASMIAAQACKPPDPWWKPVLRNLGKAAQYLGAVCVDVAGSALGGAWLGPNQWMPVTGGGET